MFLKLVAMYLLHGQNFHTKKASSKPKSLAARLSKTRSTTGSSSGVGRIILYIILGMYVVACAIGLFGGLFVMLYMLSEDGASYWTAVTIVCSLWGILGSVNLIYQQLYRAKDASILQPLPIETSTILAARFTAVYALAILSEAIFFITAFVVETILGGFSALTLIYLIVAMLVSPAIAMFFALVLAALYATLVRLAGRFAKIIQFALLFILLGGYFYVVARMSSASSEFNFDENTMAAFRATLSSVSALAYPFNFVGHFMAGDILYLLPYLAIFAILFYVVFTIMGKSFGFVADSTHIGYQGEKLDAEELSRRLSSARKKPMWLLIAKKDFGLIFDQPQAALNVYSGLLCVVYIFFLTFQNIELPRQIFPLLITAIGTGIALFNTYPSVSINIEGQQFLVLRSLPISSLDILVGKSMPTLTVYLPLAALGAIAVGISYAVSVPVVLFGLIFNVAIIIAAQEVGLIINLYRLRLDQGNALAAMKRSMNTLIHFVITLILVLPYTLLCFAQFSGTPELLCSLGIACVYVLIASGLTWYLKTHGEKILSSYNY